jgi:hypothetical protein
MAYNSNNRSERILQNRRFTTDDLITPSEALTNVLDLGVNEIYLDTRYIPSGSSQIPFSGSSGANLIVSASIVDPTIQNDLPILKYWYRQKLWRGKLPGREVYYFRQSEPPALDSQVFLDSVIEADQVTNFVSPKYISPAISPSQAGFTTENTLPNSTGYKVTVISSTISNKNSLTPLNSTVITDDKFVFDYKTGVLSWVSGEAPASTQYIYMTAYQYIGRTIQDQLVSGFTGSFQGDLIGTATGSFSGSFTGESTLTNLQLTGSFNHTGSYNLNGNIIQTGSISQSGSISVIGPIISNGINVVDNAIAMAIALG